MSLYREPGQARRRRLIAAGVIVAAAALAALVVLIAGGGGPPSQAERQQAARAAASQALDGLELVEIEYGQAVKDGRVIAPTEHDAALADVQRARDALAEHGDDLEAIDPSALARAERALARVRAAVEQHVAPSDLRQAVAAARATIEPLVRSSAHE